MPEERLSIPGRPSCSKPEDEHLAEDLFFKANIGFTLVGKQCLLGVDHQGHCSCCWAFASTEAITAAHAFKNKETIPLSKQQLIDCIFTHYKKPSWFADLGPKQCFPSSCTKAYEFATDFGIVEETQYPFTEQRGDCKGPSPGVKIFKIKGFDRLKETNKRKIATLLREQPITCAAPFVPSLRDHRGKEIIYMGPTQSETEEIEKHKAKGGNEAMHAMLIVGYGKEDGVEFYLVKNSWGEDWGYKGFAKIKCSVLSRLSYPILME
ncbi:ervatamin-B-like [Solanum tuberosum]|nr:PREDICTED: ervatamin-B-like [Solanum tuberosum]